MQAEQVERVADFMPSRAWVADRGGHAFSTFSAFDWFIRRHRDRLIQSGQLIVRRGSAGNLVGPRFDAEVLAILREEGGAPGLGFPGNAGNVAEVAP